MASTQPFGNGHPQRHSLLFENQQLLHFRWGLASRNTGHPVIFEFQVNNESCNNLGCISTKTLFVVYLKCNCNWGLSILSGSLNLGELAEI